MKKFKVLAVLAALFCCTTAYAKDFDWSQCWCNYGGGIEKGDFIVSFSHEKECRIFSINYKMMISDYNNEKYDIGYQEWNTFTICYGWLLKGYYDSKDGDVPIYACERFKIDQNGNYVIAIGDYNGNAKIYKFPIIDKDQKSIGNAINHGRKITHVKFGKVGMKDILMTSGSDGCLITWKIEEIL